MEKPKATLLSQETRASDIRVYEFGGWEEKVILVLRKDCQRWRADRENAREWGNIGRYHLIYTGNDLNEGECLKEMW